MKDFKKNIPGELGEEFAAQYCKERNIPFKKASHKEDLEQGIDAYIERKPTDIKNTKALYLFQIYDDGIIHVRHPFKIISKATHYFFVNVNEEKREFIKFVEISSLFSSSYLKKGQTYLSFKKFLHDIDVRHYSEFGLSLEQACLELKKKILFFIDKDVNLIYPNVKTNIIDFKLMKKETSPKPTISDLDIIRAKIKNMKSVCISPNTIVKPIVESIEEEKAIIVKL